jgi:glycosyltransferase involved in cell wall biosynthesis
LGIPGDAFVVCSFGWLARVKLNHRLLDAWLASELAGNESCHLVFVGGIDRPDYGDCLSKRIGETAAGSRIRITGYASDELYRNYLAAADAAVQLRTGSRGETSGTIFDCLSRGLPLIVNAHGSVAELPKYALIKIDDDFEDATLSNSLSRLYSDEILRATLAEKSKSFVDSAHHPELVAHRYWELIEDIYSGGQAIDEQALVRAISCIDAPAKPTNEDLILTASAIASNRKRPGFRQILVDVSNLAKLDLLTGIERVTKALLTAWIDDPPAGFRVEPVRATGTGYVYARSYFCQSVGILDGYLVDSPVDIDRGDLFIGLEWGADVIPALKPWFIEQRLKGLRTIFTVYDLLPVVRPEFFPKNISPLAVEWTRTIANVSHGIVCISRTTADELCNWLSREKPNRLDALDIGYFHLGADLHASPPTKGMSPRSAAILDQLRGRATILMVGTVEPRKGHTQALDALDLLWARGVEANLVIVGKLGWNMEHLAARVAKHPEKERRLFWLQGISDEMLEQVYRYSSALLAASEGEGFGLPLIEAAQFGIPIIARDIPVFREVAGDHAYYFNGDAEALADALQAWLTLGDRVPSSKELPWLTWRQSSQQYLEVVLGGNWYKHCAYGGRSALTS